MTIPWHKADIKICQESWPGQETTTLWKIPPGHREVQPLSQRWWELQVGRQHHHPALVSVLHGTKIAWETAADPFQCLSCAVRCLISPCGWHWLSYWAVIEQLIWIVLDFKSSLSSQTDFQILCCMDNPETENWRPGAEDDCNTDLKCGIQQIPSRKDSSKWFKSPWNCRYFSNGTKC